MACLNYLAYCCQNDLLTKEKIQEYVKRGMIDGLLGLFYGFCCSNTPFTGYNCFSRVAAINDFKLVHKLLGILLCKYVSLNSSYNNINSNEKQSKQPVFIQFENKPLMLHKVFQVYLKMTRECAGRFGHIDFETMQQLLLEFLLLISHILEIDHHDWKRISGANVEQLHRLYNKKLIPMLKQLTQQDCSEFENSNSLSLSPKHKHEYQKMVQSMLLDNIQTKAIPILYYLDEIYTHTVGWLS